MTDNNNGTKDSKTANHITNWIIQRILIIQIIQVIQTIHILRILQTIQRIHVLQSLGIMYRIQLKHYYKEYKGDTEFKQRT